MADHNKPAFPTDTTHLVTIPECARGPDGLRAAYTFFPEREVELKANGDYQPIAAITVFGPAVAAFNGGTAVVADGLSRVSWWLASVGYVNTSDGGGPGTIPPDIDYEVRGSIARRATRFAAGTSVFTSYQDEGFIIQVSGILCTQWEFWARINPFEGFDVGTKIKIRVACVADRQAGAPFEVKKGDIGNG